MAQRIPKAVVIQLPVAHRLPHLGDRFHLTLDADFLVEDIGDDGYVSLISIDGTWDAYKVEG